MNNKFYCCPDCGSDDIEFEAWIDEHSLVINYGDQIWCSNCCASIKDITSKTEYKEEEGGA